MNINGFFTARTSIIGTLPIINTLLLRGYIGVPEIWTKITTLSIVSLWSILGGLAFVLSKSIQVTPITATSVTFGTTSWIIANCCCINLATNKGTTDVNTLAMKIAGYICAIGTAGLSLVSGMLSEEIIDYIDTKAKTQDTQLQTSHITSTIHIDIPPTCTTSLNQHSASTSQQTTGYKQQTYSQYSFNNYDLSKRFSISDLFNFMQVGLP